jgi:hypothetical protein
MEFTQKFRLDSDRHAWAKLKIWFYVENREKRLLNKIMLLA